LRVPELHPQFIGRVLQIFPTRVRGLGIGRIGEVSGIMDARAVLFDLDFALKLSGNPIKFGDHRLDLGDPAPLLVYLKLLQTDEGFTCLHRLDTPRSPRIHGSSLAAGTRAGPAFRTIPERLCRNNVSFVFLRPAGSAPATGSHFARWRRAATALPVVGSAHALTTRPRGRGDLYKPPRMTWRGTPARKSDYCRGSLPSRLDGPPGVDRHDVDRPATFTISPAPRRRVRLRRSQKLVRRAPSYVRGPTATTD